jgi:hypothetical protein
VADRKGPSLRGLAGLRDASALRAQRTHSPGEESVGDTDFREAVECGTDGIAHLPADPLEPGLARLAAERRVFVTPTLLMLLFHEATGPSRCGT